MALARILVDGYSLLHEWEELAPGWPRYSAAAREALLDELTRYHDATGTPITVVFDGNRPDRGPAETRSSPHVEILFSKAGQTADQIIERVAHRMQPYGEVLAVTNDHAERDTVLSMGGMASSCRNFILTVQRAVEELERDVRNYNSKERNRFKKAIR
jgi:predicted RNA-binding protein with PIN domain